MSLLGSVKKALGGEKKKSSAKEEKEKGASKKEVSEVSQNEKGIGDSKEMIAVMRSGALTGILQQPHVTEKATALNEEGRYVFRVHPDATKVQVKKAIETLYGVRVAGVNSVSVPSKRRRRGQHVGTRSGYKKAIVTLEGDQRIEILPH